MEIRVYDTNNGSRAILSSVIDSFANIIITHNFRSPSEILLISCLPFSPSSIKIPTISEGQILRRPNSDGAYIVDSVKIIVDAFDVAKQVAHGVTHEALLHGRVTLGSKFYAGTVSSIAKQLIDDATTNTLSPASRALPGVSLDFDPLLGIVTMFHASPGPLDLAVHDALLLSDLSINSVFNPSAGETTLTLTQGRQRSIPPAIDFYDTDYDTVSQISLTRSYADTPNAVYVLGEIDPKTDNPKCELVELPSAIESNRVRREMILKIEQKSVDESGAKLSDAQYRGGMRAHGMAALKSLSRKIRATAKINASSDARPGDIVLLRIYQNERLGISKVARIESITERYSWDSPDNPTLTAAFSFD